MPVHEERACVDHQNGAHGRARVEHLERLVEMLLVLHDDQRRAPMLEEVTHLTGSARRIDAVGDRAERLRRQIGDRPLRARVADDGYRLAAREPVFPREPEREGRDAIGEAAPGRLAPDAELLRAKRDARGPRPRALGNQARNRARAQRTEIHAARIIPTPGRSGSDLRVRARHRGEANDSDQLVAVLIATARNPEPQPYRVQTLAELWGARSRASLLDDLIEELLGVRVVLSLADQALAEERLEL